MSDDLKRRINDVNKAGMMNPKAVISVDLFGLPADYLALKKICKKYDKINRRCCPRFWWLYW